MDWHSRKVLSWRLSNSMDARFCVEALKEARAKCRPSEICFSDQGSQFTSSDFTEVLLDAKVKISMDGRGRWIDNRLIERLWLPPIRMRLPERLRDRVRGPQGDRRVDQLLQRETSALIAWLADAS